MIDLSFIIPVYNRPDELDELLESMLHLHEVAEIEHEVIVVEDGSTISSEQVVKKYSQQLNIQYVTQANTGPSGARNHGAKLALGTWLIFLDSDTILPPEYLENIQQEMAKNKVDLWGGPDKAREDFTVIQRAIDYSMTSIVTTGGIRGGKDGTADKFYPRTFNLGVSKEAFLTVNGFSQDMRYGEDLDFSMRILESGFQSALYSTAWVYHKRRVDFKQFFNQVRHSGRARVELNKRHPGTMKLTHFFPLAFALYNILMIPGYMFGTHILLLIYLLLIIFDAYAKDSMEMAVHAVAATYVQFFGYALGMLEGFFSKSK